MEITKLNVNTQNQENIDNTSMFKLSYGLFVLTAKDEKDNGCIINTVTQITSSPNVISIAVNKQNYTCQMILKTGVFNVSVLDEGAKFDTFRHFGFQSGKDVNKFDNYEDAKRSKNGLLYITKNTNAFLSAKVISAVDCGTHYLFLSEVTEGVVLSSERSVTYDYYFANIKPKPEKKEEKKKGFVCKICGYIYEGETLPDDFICPICKHPASDFEAL